MKMKRTLSIITAIIMIVLLAVPVAYADSASPSREQKQDLLPETIPVVKPDGGRAYEIVEVMDEKTKEDDDYYEHRVWVPIPDLYMYTYGQRRILDSDELVDFENSYAVMKKNTKDMVLYFFWLTLTENYLEYLEEYDAYYFRLDFKISSSIKDGDIIFSSDGVDIDDDFVIVNGDGTVTVLFEYLPAAISIRIKK